MAKNKTVGRSSGNRPASADAATVPKVDGDNQRVRGKPVSLHPLSFKQALQLMINTPPPTKKKRRKRGGP